MKVAIVFACLLAVACAVNVDRARSKASGMAAARVPAQDMGPSDGHWAKIAPLLDALMAPAAAHDSLAHLRDTYRNAVQGLGAMIAHEMAKPDAADPKAAAFGNLSADDAQTAAQLYYRGRHHMRVHIREWQGKLGACASFLVWCAQMRDRFLAYDSYDGPTWGWVVNNRGGQMGNQLTQAQSKQIASAAINTNAIVNGWFPGRRFSARRSSLTPRLPATGAAFDDKAVAKEIAAKYKVDVPKLADGGQCDVKAHELMVKAADVLKGGVKVEKDAEETVD